SAVCRRRGCRVGGLSLVLHQGGTEEASGGGCRGGQDQRAGPPQPGDERATPKEAIPRRGTLADTAGARRGGREGGQLRSAGGGAVGGRGHAHRGRARRSGPA